MTPNQIVMLMSVYATGTLGNLVPEGSHAHTDALHFLMSNELIEQEVAQ